MSIQHILTEIVNRPLMVTPAKLEVILSLLNKKSDRSISPDLSLLSHMNSVSGQEIVSRARPVNQVEQEEDEMFIEVVPVLGSLVARNHGWGESDGSGLRSYRTIMRDMAEARRNPQIGGIILDADSFGGMSSGCERATRLIAEISAEKPVYAVVDLNAYSACYSIASACSKIILTDNDAGVGSIGCIAIHCDISKWAEQEGLNYTLVTFGAKKDQFTPTRPLSKEDVAALQKSVDAYGMRFAETVAELRNMKLADVLATEAGAFSGKQAIELGLADDIMSFDEAAAMMADEILTGKRTSFSSPFQSTQQSKGDDDMESLTTKQRMEKLLTAEDGPAAIKELGYIEQSAAAASVADAEKKVKAEVIEVAQLCQLGELSTAETVAVLESGSTPEQARETIQKQKAERSNKQTIKSTITPLSGDGKHPLIASCEKLAEKQ